MLNNEQNTQVYSRNHMPKFKKKMKKSELNAKIILKKFQNAL